MVDAERSFRFDGGTVTQRSCAQWRDERRIGVRGEPFFQCLNAPGTETRPPRRQRQCGRGGFTVQLPTKLQRHSGLLEKYR